MAGVKVSSTYEDVVGYCRTHGDVPTWAERDQVQEVFNELHPEDKGGEVEYILYDYLMRRH